MINAIQPFKVRLREGPNFAYINYDAARDFNNHVFRVFVTFP